MFKRALIASAILATFSSLALANGGSFAPAPAPQCVGNFYAGIGVSRDNVHLDTNLTNNIFGLVPTAAGIVPVLGSYSRDFDWSAEGVGGTLFGGYNMVFQNRYTLAAEVFGSISSADGDFNINSNLNLTPAVLGSAALTEHGDIKMNSTFGVSLLPGIKVTDSTTTFIRIGYAISHFKYSDSGAVITAPGLVTGALVPPVTTAFGLNTLPSSFSKYRGGIELGVGGQTMVTNNVGVRAEYDWTDYSSYSKSTGVNSTGIAVPLAGTIPVSQTGTVSIKPQVDSFTLSAFYNFS